MTRQEIENYLRENKYHPFYSDNYWIKEGESDYSGVTLCEAYCRVRYKEINAEDLFDKVMELEYILNKNKKLGIIGKTFGVKEDLKKLFEAKWDYNKKIWYVCPDMIKNKDFHDFCYNRSRPFAFEWISE